jgi:glycerophosphoryl diester phosphodiesterase
MPLYYPSSPGTDVVSPLFEATTSNPIILSHRASRQSFPENSLGGFIHSATACDGAEVSFSCTADRVPVIMHDTTFDRTTNLAGNISDFTYPELLNASGVIDYTTVVGAGWSNQSIPLFSDVLGHCAGRIPLLVEPKSGSSADYATFYRIAQGYISPTKKFLIKAYRSTAGGAGTTAAAAHALGYKTWIYYFNGDTNAQVTYGANDPNVDILALDAAMATEEVIGLASATGKPVCIHGVFRRSEIDAFRALGATMFMTPQPAYNKRITALRATTNWQDRVRDSGEITGSADASTFPTMTTADESITLPTGSSNTVMLGQLAATTAAATNRIVFDVMWPTLPTSTLHAGIAFGKADDSQFTFQASTNSNGYHLLVRPNEGYVQLYTHVSGSSTGTKISELGVADQHAMVGGQWATIQIDVTAADITIQRTDAGNVTLTPITVATTHARGPYIHITPNSSNNSVQFRRVTVS